MVTGAWDSFLSALVFADPLFQFFNASVAQPAATNRARFADPFPIFNPQGDLTPEVQAICTLTLLCNSGRQPSIRCWLPGAGGRVFEASQYVRLLH
jgi:hypothetical protein